MVYRNFKPLLGEEVFYLGGIKLSTKHFCSCDNLKCKNHPNNHSLGCDPCIKKNLAGNEIPDCFFKLVNEDLSELKSYNLGDFAKFYLENS